MRTIGLPVRLGIGILAVTSVYAGATAGNGGVDSDTTRELAIVQDTKDGAIASASSADEAAPSVGTARSGYMVISGRRGPR